MQEAVMIAFDLGRSLCVLSESDESFELRVQEYVGALQALIDSQIELGHEELECLERQHEVVIARVADLQNSVSRDLQRLKKNKSSLIKYISNQKD